MACKRPRAPNSINSLAVGSGARDTLLSPTDRIVGPWCARMHCTIHLRGPIPVDPLSLLSPERYTQWDTGQRAHCFEFELRRICSREKAAALLDRLLFFTSDQIMIWRWNCLLMEGGRSVDALVDGFDGCGCWVVGVAKMALWFVWSGRLCILDYCTMGLIWDRLFDEAIN